MTTIKVTPEQLLHVSRQLEQGRKELENICLNLTSRMMAIQSQWDGVTRERFFHDFEQSRLVLENALEGMLNSSQDLREIAERFEQADKEQVSLGAIAGQIAMNKLGAAPSQASNNPEYTMVYNTQWRMMMPTDKDGNVTQETLQAYQRDTGSLKMAQGPNVEPESEDIFQYQLTALKEGVHPFTGEPVSQDRAKLLIASLQLSKMVMAFSGVYNRGYKVPAGGLRLPKSPIPHRNSEAKTQKIYNAEGNAELRATRRPAFDEIRENGITVNEQTFQLNNHAYNSLFKSGRKDIMPDDIKDALTARPKPAEAGSVEYVNPVTGTSVFVSTEKNEIVGVWPSTFKR